MKLHECTLRVVFIY